MPDKKIEWLNEEEDEKYEKEIIDTLVKFETLKYHYPQWFSQRETETFKKQRKGLPLI